MRNTLLFGLAVCLLGLTTACASGDPSGVSSSDSAGGQDTTYLGLTIAAVNGPSDKNINFTFVPPNILITSTVPGGGSQVDYAVTSVLDPSSAFHLNSDAPDASFKVSVAMGRFTGGDYTVEAFADGSQTSFGKSTLHVTGSYTPVVAK